MTQQPPHAFDKPYAEEDLGPLDRTDFDQRPTPDGRGVMVSGACPRCHGRTETEIRRGIPGIGGKGLVDLLIGRRSAAVEPEPLVGEVHFCECGHAHPELPPDSLFLGCGASWRLRA